MKKGWIILGVFVGVLILITILYFIEESNTEAILHGNKLVNVTVNTNYTDLGFDVFHNDKLLNKSKYTVKEQNNVDLAILGKYIVTYDIKYHLRHFHLERVVNVVDDIKPEITANIDNIERDYCTKKDKVKLSYSASDNYDKDLTNQIEMVEEDNQVKLTVLDSSGNKEEKIIPIIYLQKPKPVFKLKGNSTIYLALNSKYQEQGAGYYDGCGKELNEKITISGNVDTGKVGTYTVTYSLASGAKLIRKINVYDESSIGKGKVLYLTFDDGPGQYTQKILNTLDKYNVKATFFVTNQFPNYAYLIKNEYQKGHAVAVHTYSHNYNVYRSVSQYISDFNKMNDVIQKYTGIKSKIFRFPGGSSNTVSRNYAKGVVSEIAKKMTNDGYQYFDWDISSGDAASKGQSEIYSNVVNGAKSCSKCVILMHDIKKTTANELDNILKTLTSRGYSFATLNTNSPVVHHKIAN